ncbi:aspartate kinase [Gammaproteobacteria bacterium]|nr:aspartate kinase [Gammaproteobacteria bacterium]|tara:strand:+ start:661 stop:1878 length:1218 start_codon:yes stop_codon:yes gene_type:complete
MSIVVQKYGGTSIGTIDKISQVADKVISEKNNGNNLVVVVSAMSGETNRLLNLAKSINPDISGRELDTLISTGEQVTISLLAMTLIKKGHKAISLTGSQAGIFTDDIFNKARIDYINNLPIKKYLDLGNIVVVAGFQGITKEGDITTLGRGGSDTSAVAISVALDAKECQIFTDVDGVYTTDPRISPGAKKIDQITTEEMLELSSQGSKVLQPRAVEFAGKYDIGIRVLSTFEEGTGTLIKKENDSKMEKAIISGIAFNKDEAQLNIRGVPDQPGIASLILGPIADLNIDVDMIVQNVGEDGLANFTFTVPRNDYKVAMQSLEESSKKLQAKKVKGNNEIVKISMVGVGMRTHAGIASKMFSVLAENNINISMISTSEIKISIVTNEDNLETAVNVLHKEFNLDK